MKARHFKKLRKKARYYEVTLSDSLFGTFYNDRFKETILARNPREAALRLKKRWGLSDSVEGYPCEEKWAKYRVKLKDKPDHHRHYRYY